MAQKIGIIGASGHGKIIADLLVSCGITSLVFYDDRWPSIKNFYGYAVVGDVTKAVTDSKALDAMYVAVGNNSLRAQIQLRLENIGDALVHPRAYVSRSARLAKGTIVLPFAVVNADVSIGEGVIVNSSAVIEHDCVIGDFVHISPRAALAGGVQVGSHSWVGIGATVIQLIQIGSHTTVGAGAVVIKHISDSQTVVGIPAAPIKR